MKLGHELGELSVRVSACQGRPVNSKLPVNPRKSLAGLLARLMTSLASCALAIIISADGYASGGLTRPLTLNELTVPPVAAFILYMSH